MRQVVGMWVGAMVFAVLAAAPAIADGPRIAQIKTASGEASIVRGEARIAAKPGDALYVSDIIETGPSGTIGITFVDNTVFSAGPGSRLTVQEFRFDSSNFRGEMLANLRTGTLTVVSGDITRSSPGAMKIITPTSTLGVRGTTFAIRVY